MNVAYWETKHGHQYHEVALHVYTFVYVPRGRLAAKRCSMVHACLKEGLDMSIVFQGIKGVSDYFA